MKIGLTKRASNVPPARVALSPEVRDRFKRERIALAVAELAHRVGARKVTVSQITGEARIARSTFYELFANREEAVGYAARLANDRLRSRIDEAAGGRKEWAERTRATLGSVCEAVAAQPRLYELSLLEGSVADGEWVPFDPVLVDALVAALRPEGPKPEPLEPARRTEKLLTYSILSLIAGRLRRGEADSLPALAGELAELAMIPHRDPGGVQLTSPEDEMTLTTLDLPSQRP